MARIRTIKPEFPQSESTGRLSRDARLCFIMLWTIADDYGRCRAAPRMLSGLLYPYDDDAPALMQGWLDELEREKCITQYSVDGYAFLEIANWSKHQRVDNAGKSNIPPPIKINNLDDEFAANRREPPRDSANFGDSPLDQGPRTKEGTKDQGRDQGPRIKNLVKSKIDKKIIGMVLDKYRGLGEVAIQPRLVTETMESAIAARVEQHPEHATEDFWDWFFDQIRQSAFLSGRVTPSPGHRKFRLSIDWLFNKTNFAKVVNGNYAEEKREEIA